MNAGVPCALVTHLRTCNFKICDDQSSDQSVKRILVDVRQAIVFWNVIWRKTSLLLLGGANEGHRAVVGGLLEEALKDHTSVPQ